MASRRIVYLVESIFFPRLIEAPNMGVFQLFPVVCRFDKGLTRERERESIYTVWHNIFVIHVRTVSREMFVFYREGNHTHHT